MPPSVENVTVGPALVLAAALLALACLLTGAFLRRRRGPRGPRPVAVGRLTADQPTEGMVPPANGPAGSSSHRRPPIERIAADLRRLNRQRLGVATRSVMWHHAIMEAYDERLRLASSSLGVVEYLDGLGGMDLEIERLRVEGALQSAGLNLRSAPAWPRRQQF